MNEEKKILRSPSRETLLSIFSGILLAAGFPPSYIGITVFFGFLPLFIVLSNSNSKGRTLRAAYLTFFVFNTITNYWVGSWTREADPFLMIAGAALIIAHPLFFAVPILLYDGVRRRWNERVALLVFPFIWAGFEYAHSLGELGYPWLSLVYSQTKFTSFIQIATITGPYAISFLIACVNVLLYKAYRSYQSSQRKIMTRYILGVLIIIFLPALYGIVELNTSLANERSLKVAIIQPNVNSWEKWNGDVEALLEEYKKQIEQIRHELPDVVVLPETAIPTFILQPRYSVEWNNFTNYIDTTGIALITGFADIVYYPDSTLAPRSAKRLFDGMRYDVYNSSMLVEPGHAPQRHHKIRLTPFGERVPYADAFTFLIDALQWRVGISGWGVGDTKNIFTLHDTAGTIKAKLWAMICYEVLFPDFVRTYVDSGAEALMELTNDGWYGYSAAPYQHNAIASLRAVENRRTMIRSTNTGISSIIDPFGRTLVETSLFKQQIIVRDIPLYSVKTFYTRYGEIFGKFSLILACGVLILLFVRPKKL